ncbi:MAG: glycosyl transferase [Candidatus Saccharibacteria bacterium]|nr:glycosyl transferase [Candidatus Saccharibacteria bacterium]
MKIAGPKLTRQLRHFSQLAGKFDKVPRYESYRVRFVPVSRDDNYFYRAWLYILSYGAFIITLCFCLVLFWPSHWIIVQNPDSSTHFANLIMLICLMLLQLFTIIGTFSATRSTIKAKDPVPVAPPRNLRVAFITTRAPGEPASMVETTLAAAKRIRYRSGTVDVWLLDETDDPEIEAICDKLGVHHFSRAGIACWNTAETTYRWQDRLLRRPKPTTDRFYAARSKHGNINSWMDYLRLTGIEYDILAGVDTDQVPLPNYLNRLLGYFRDPDVAYVVGPQVYGNYGPGLKGLVARWAESQASFFQSTIQRAGNASRSAMFVGTNYAVRFATLKQIGGFQPCITEDMATGLAIHSSANPDTGQRWRSVYTPDVLAIGEGPNFWAPYFTQQWRWAAGTFDTWRRVVWRIFWKLSPKAMLHYFLMLTYYPMTALTWLLAVTSSMIYLIWGATAVLAPWGAFIALYLMTLVMQLSLYFWNRRYNVSPHEPSGSYGVAGMVISSLTAPIYLSALIGITVGRKPHFVVTTKGSNDNPDWLPTFKSHGHWAAVLALGLTYGLQRGREHPAMLVWVGVLCLVCIAPMALGLAVAIPDRLRTLNFRKSLRTEEVQHA